MTAQEARALIAQQCGRWPGLTAQDLVKALYQAALGCGHFAPDEARAAAMLREEAARLFAKTADAPLVEPIGPRFCRVHLAPYEKTGASTDTLARLFALSAGADVSGGRAALEDGLCALEAMADAGELPLDAEDVRAYLAAYRATGCPSVHHSEAFRARYAPAYRVVERRFADCLPLLSRIDRLLAQRPRVLVAIDGMSASGKSTLAALLHEVYGAPVVHMDDFFLQPHQRTPERYAAPGENVDHERFAQEVLTPLLRGEAFAYRPFLCQTFAFGKPVRVEPSRLTVVEGSYSLHPALAGAYDLRVLLRISPQMQSGRILARNGEAMHRRFMELWVPLENAYFEATGIDTRCDLRGCTAQDGSVSWEELP